MQTWHLHIKGQVQGVGFRPFVFLLAQEMSLKGYVQNTVDGVHVLFNASAPMAHDFSKRLVERAPVLAHVTASDLKPIEPQVFADFQINHSDREGDPNLLLTPDFGLCTNCQAELYLVEDRRNNYPFTTCTHCGPRYSIVHTLPYDRINTSMQAFAMCANCQAEYENTRDRRYYSQTNSCPDCCISLHLYDDTRQMISQDPDEIISRVVQGWREGAIIAIKGIGGYLLTCDASNDAAVAKLRARKRRPSKPFALMAPNLDTLKSWALRDKELEALQSYQAPIVLLTGANREQIVDGVAPGLDQLGVMLPYTPLYHLLLVDFAKIIVATSGNVSESPILFADQKALEELSGMADLLVVNDREIVVPQDDSVIRYTDFEKQRIILRRSRGFAPTYINPGLKLPDDCVLATGAMLKSTFALQHHRNIYLSQYLGDLQHFDTQENYRHTVEHFLQLFDTQPSLIICDKHPDYPSTRYGQALAQALNVAIEPVQHHVAHLGAVLGEHHLLHAQEPVLGIIWDGTGLGDDGQIWGGEFFTYDHYQFQRRLHFDYFDFILGDKMPREPRISALSACWQVEGAKTHLLNKFTKTEWQVYGKLLSGHQTLQTSSVGRIFDAVASLLGILDRQTYEGEAAMLLETLATRYFRKHGLQMSEYYGRDLAFDQTIATQVLLAELIRDLEAGKAKDFIAAKFHYSLVKLIANVATQLNIHQVACSGGVFQNGLIVDLMKHYLTDDFTLYFHRQLSPNDENVSLGQLVCHQIQKHHTSPIQNKSINHVFSDSR